MHKKIIRGTVYYYTSIRENGRIKTIYLGRKEEEASERERLLKNKRSSAGPSAIKNFFSTRLPIYLSIVILIAFGFLFLRGYYVGYVAVTGPEIYAPGEKLTGVVNINFSSGELYPKDSVVEVSLDDQVVQIGIR